MKLDKENTKQIIKIICIGIILYWILNNFSVINTMFGNVLHVLYPFVLGACMAFVFNMPMKFFERLFSKSKKIKIRPIIKRFLSILLSIIVIVLVITLIITIVIPQLINVCSLLIEKLPYYTDQIKNFTDETLRNESIKNIVKDINIDTEETRNMITKNVTTLLISSINIITKIVSGIANFIIALVFAVYLLLSKEKIKSWSKKILLAYLPTKKAQYVFKTSRLSSRTFKNFISGQIIEACILGVICFLGMLILKIPYAGTIAVLVGFTALVPIVGAFIGVAIGVLLIVTVDPIKAVIFVIFFIILQQVEGNIIYPKVVGNSVGLPGILVLFAVTIGGTLFGIIGMLIGLPVVSIIYTILKEDVDAKLKMKRELKRNNS